jgi:signal transduction histidine kinase/CheY-like chemotaxis protein
MTGKSHSAATRWRLPMAGRRADAAQGPKQPIARKLALLVMSAVTISAAIMTLVALWQSLSNYAETKTRALVGTAHIFAAATAKATAARDVAGAYQAMKAIAQIPDLRFARIDLPQGLVLAAIGEATQLDADLRLPSEGRSQISPFALLTTRTIETQVSIVEGGEEVGRFVLVAETGELAAQLMASMRGEALAAVVAAAIGLLVAARLQRGLTEPLRELSRTVAEIEQGHQYRVQVEATSDDEVGQLIDGFNRMFREIDARDASLAEHRRNLEREVRDRTQDFRVAKEAAEAANVAKSDFLATMSHEIRTPMNGVLAMAELLAASDIPQRQRRYAEVISKSGQSLLAIINDILDFSKIESGKLDLEKIALDPAELAEDVVSLFAERAREKQIDLVCRVAAQTPQTMQGDPVRITQVVGNLVNNALKFTPTGSVTLDIGPDPRDATRLRVAVIDTGVGVAPEKLADIFGAFSQADQSTTRHCGGTGLGLAIGKRLVEAMGGEIVVESVIGAGSTFSFSIPMGETTPALAWPQAAKGARAIVAVAGEATRETLRAYLEAAGYVVETRLEDAISGVGVALVAADPDRLAAPRIGAAQILCLAALGEGAAHRLVQDGLVDAAIARPLARSEIQVALAALAKGERLRDAIAATPSAAAPARQFPGLRVLVADDGAVNREVAIEALTRLGAVVVTAQNGAEAVAAAARERFDVVLMDLSMPDVDGLEATRRIRAAERGAGRRATPVVAVTAHVVGAAADSWRDAGMDAALHKPFTLAALADCLAKFVKPEPARAPAASASPDSALGPRLVERAQSEPLLNEATLRYLLDMGGAGGFAQRVFGLYLEHAPRSVEDARRALTNGDVGATGRAAHALKSMSLSIGASRVAAAAGEIERRASLEPERLGESELSALAALMEQTCAAVRARIVALDVPAQAVGF